MSTSNTLIENLLRKTKDLEASDLHLKSDAPPAFRVHGKLVRPDPASLGEAEILKIIEESLPEVFRREWESTGQIDYALALPGVGRFRINAFHQRTLPGMVLRRVNDAPPTFKDLNHESELFEKLCRLKDGIVLVCGPTGSGKSSTLGAMLDHLNRTEAKHVVTLEDPIEFNYTDDHCLINQREVGIDVPSFGDGLRSVLRQDPDIILVGEMRDRQTFETAIRAAETGHLVFGTLHASDCQQAVQRLFEFFPPQLQIAMRSQIAGTLKGVLTQRLVPMIGGKGRVPVVESFVVDTLGRTVLREGEFAKIKGVIEAGRESGSKSFNQDLIRLVKAGKVAKDEAMRLSSNPKQLEMNLKGIFLSEGGIVQ